MMQPVLNLSPFLGTPKNEGVTSHFRPILGPRDGKGEVASFVFVTFLGDPPERKGCIAIPPTFGPPRRRG